MNEEHSKECDEAYDVYMTAWQERRVNPGPGKEEALRIALEKYVTGQDNCPKK